MEPNLYTNGYTVMFTADWTKWWAANTGATNPVAYRDGLLSLLKQAIMVISKDKSSFPLRL